jgi:hypothetical protein
MIDIGLAHFSESDFLLTGVHVPMIPPIGDEGCHSLSQRTVTVVGCLPGADRGLSSAGVLVGKSYICQ